MAAITPPAPTTGPQGQDGDRIAYTRRSRRILYGEHVRDVLERIALQIPEVRREAWGWPDMSTNPFKAVWSALSTLYDRPPTVTSTGDVEAAQELADRLAGQGYWQLMARGQRDCLALRELWMRVTVEPRPGVEGAYDPVYEPVYPDLVCAVARPDRPGVPVALWHARLHDVASRPEWRWHYYSVDGPEPHYAILSASGELLDTIEWPDVWRDREGRAILPYVLYHAAQTPYIYDPYQTIELVECTLNAAVLRTYVAHVARSAAWRQRYAIDARPVGTSSVDENGDGRARQRVVADPATILMFERIDETGNPSLGTFDVPALPDELWSYVDQYERKAVLDSGVISPDPQAMGGDARSGYAITVNRDEQRQAQRRFEPLFRRGDQEVLRLTAIMLNRAENANYPEFGYRVTYHGIPQSAAEREAQRRHLVELLGAGLISPVAAYQELHPGVTEAEALAQLRAIRETQAALGGQEVSDG